MRIFSLEKNANQSIVSLSNHKGHDCLIQDNFILVRQGMKNDFMIFSFPILGM